jgi:cytidylate kinase
VSLEVASKRVINDQRGAEEKYSSLEEAKKLLAERAATEMVRYKDIYNLNYMDFSNYNLIIDSTYCTPDKIVEIILKEAKAYEEHYAKTGQETSKMLVSPRRLVKDEDILEEDMVALSDLVQEYTKGMYAIDDIVKVTKKEDDYFVEDGMKYAKAAYLAKVPYVPIETVK